MTDEHSTKAIRAIIDEIRGWAKVYDKDSPVKSEYNRRADALDAQLAAILQRIEDQETQIAAKDQALRIARAQLHGWIDGCCPSDESLEEHRAIWADELAPIESALTPDDGKRVVDVELLRDLVGLLHSLTNDPMLRISIQVFLDKLAALIG